MKQEKLYEVEVMDVMRLGEFERELVERGVEYKRIYDKFIIGDEEIIAMLMKNDDVKVRTYKGGSVVNLTNEELIREIERDIEGVIFNYKLELKWREDIADMPESRKEDYWHMNRALQLLDDLKSRL